MEGAHGPKFSDANPLRKTHIVVLNSHPVQYFAPLYAYLNATPDIEITVLYLSDSSIRGSWDPGFRQDVKWDIELLAGYRSLFLSRATHTGSLARYSSLLAPAVWSEVRSGRYDVLWLHGHQLAMHHIALAAAKSMNIPVMMRGETHLKLVRGFFKALLRRPVMRAFYGVCDCLLAIGTANAEFYRAVGVPERKIFMVPYAVDNNRFSAAARIDAVQRTEVRKRLGVTDEYPAVLFASKFQKRKNPDDLIRAANRLAVEGLRFHLVMVGAGELESNLRDLVKRSGMTNVIFPGFVNQTELPKVFAACDVFVLPSENEPWGLVINEAMCAGMPIVVADEVGCVPDLVKHGDNGFTFLAGDIDGLAAALRQIIQDPSLRLRMSKASLQRISGWSYRQCLDGIRAAVASLRHTYSPP